MNIYNETKFIMQKYDVHPNKNLGQNFLFDEVALQTIIQDLTSEDTVLEIGPGLGTLTQMMAEKAKKVIAVEVDHNMVEILEDRFKLYENVEIIHEDVLKGMYNSNNTIHTGANWLVWKAVVNWLKNSLKLIFNA